MKTRTLIEQISIDHIGMLSSVQKETRRYSAQTARHDFSCNVNLFLWIRGVNVLLAKNYIWYDLHAQSTSYDCAVDCTHTRPMNIFISKLSMVTRRLITTPVCLERAVLHHWKSCGTCCNYSVWKNRPCARQFCRVHVLYSRIQECIWQFNIIYRMWTELK